MTFVRAHEIVRTHRQGGTQVPVLRGVSLEIRRGEFVAIAGPPGSGKTTLLEMVGCLDRPTSGTCVIAGHDVAGLRGDKLARLRRRSVGFVDHRVNLVPGASALENLELPLFHRGMPLAERRERALSALDRVGLAALCDAAAADLTAGERLRIAIARALLHRPRLLLADDLTRHASPKAALETMAVFQRLNEQGLTILLVTRDLRLAEQALRVVILEDGAVREDRPARRIVLA